MKTAKQNQTTPAVVLALFATLVLGVAVLLPAAPAGAASDVGIIVYKTGDGSGTVTSTPPGTPPLNCGQVCFAGYPLNQVVFLRAVPASGSHFVRWGGACVGEEDTCQVTMNPGPEGTMGLTVRAEFERDHGTRSDLLVFTDGTGSGTVTSTPGSINCGFECVDTFDTGTTVVLTAKPDRSSVFAGWSGACSGTASTCTVKLDRDRTVQAVFNSRKSTSTQFGSLRLRPKSRAAKAGSRIVFKAQVRNAGNTILKATGICVKAPAKLVKVKKCVKTGSLAPGKKRIAKFRVKVLPKAKGLRGLVTLKFTATGKGTSPRNSKAYLRLK